MTVEEQLTTEGYLPHRIKPILMAALAPTAEWPRWAILVQTAAAAAAGAFTSLPDSQRFMVWAMVFDLGTGFFCGIFTRGGLRARLMTKGLMVKGLSFALVSYIGAQPELMIGVGTLQMPLGVGVAIWYGAAEWVSVFENLDELGAPVPKFLRVLLARAKEAMDRADLADRAATALFGERPKVGGSDEPKT